MDNTRLYTARAGQANQQHVSDNRQSDNRPEKSVEDIVRYVRHVGRLNKANRQLVAGIEREKFNQAT